MRVSDGAGVVTITLWMGKMEMTVMGRAVGRRIMIFGRLTSQQ